MVKFILWVAVALSLAAGFLEARILLNAEEEIKEAALVLNKPQYDWVRSTCQPGVDWCMGGSDYIKHQMYMEGLKHEAQCNR